MNSLCDHVKVVRRDFVFKFFSLSLIASLFLFGCRTQDDAPQVSRLATDTTSMDKPAPSTETPKTPRISNEKLKAATEAALRRDIQTKKDEMARKRQDLDRANNQAETAKDRVASLEREIAGTVPERVPINTASDAAIFGSVVDQRRANQAAEQKKVQLRTEVEKQQLDLEQLKQKISTIENDVAALEKEIEDLNQELTDIATGKKIVQR